MTIDVTREILAGPPGPPMPEDPVVIGDLFGWLHVGINRRGVILCGTHGYEQHCAHRSWRGLAGRIAATGCTTLRFDYPGEGDSGDVGAGRLEAWTGAIRRTIRHLREEMQVEEIVLVGLRLGGTLAALAAQDEAVDRLVLLAPFATGRAYLREMKLQARAFNQVPDGGPVPGESGVLNVGGFALGTATLSELSVVSLVQAERSLAPHILLMGTDQDGLAEHYAALGSCVTTAPFPDLAGLVADPMTSRMTEATASAVANFAANDAAQRTTLPLLPPRAAGVAGATWVEAPVRFGPNIFGIACRPVGTVPNATVLFVNLGLNVHSGYGRQTTTLARRLAGLGVGSLRMDLLGAGDSPERQDGELPLYNLEAVDDIRAALDYLAGIDAGPVVVMGTCNGAYLAFHAICQDHRIKGAVLANLYCFDWNLTHGGVPFSGNPVLSTAAYTRLARQGAAWRRVFSGQTPIVAIVRGLARQTIGRAWRRIARAVRSIGREEAIPNRIAKLRRRGAHLLLLYSDGDLGLADVRAQLGRSPGRVTRVLGEPIRILDGAGHALGTTRAQAALLEALQDLISKIRNDPAGCISP